MKKITYLLLIILLLLPLGVLADMDDDYDNDRNYPVKPWELRVWLHGYQLNETVFDDSTTYNNLFYVGFGGELLLTKSKIGFKFQGSVSFPELSADNNSIQREDVSYIFWQGHAALTYHLSGFSGIDPYLQAGFGATGGVKRLALADQYCNESGELIETEVGLVIYPMIGAGANFFLSKHMFIGGEAQLLLAQFTPAGSERVIKTFSASRFKFDVKVGFCF